MIKGGGQPYLPGRRAWIKVRSHTTAEGLIGGVTGTLDSQATLLLARYDVLGHRRMIARTTPLSTAGAAAARGGLTPIIPGRGTASVRAGAPAASWNSTLHGSSWWPSFRPILPSIKVAIATRSASCGCVKTLVCSRCRPSVARSCLTKDLGWVRGARG